MSKRSSVVISVTRNRISINCKNGEIGIIIYIKRKGNFTTVFIASTIYRPAYSLLMDEEVNSVSVSVSKVPSLSNSSLYHV